MQEFHEGDLVEAVKGETVIRARVEENNGTQGIPMGGIAYYYLKTLEADGFTLTVIEKAAPPLPTEPGWYLGRPGSRNYAHLQLCADADCEDSSEGPHWYRPDQSRVLDPSEVAEYYLPLERLELASVTAKKVLDAIRARIGSIDSAYDFQAVAAEFGVTE